MNKKKSILLTVLLLVPSLFFTYINAQVELEPYSWDSYGMGFSIPKTFTVLENDSIKFSVGDSLINLTIYPVDASAIDSSNMDSLLQQWAIQNSVDIQSDFEHFNDEGNYYGVLCVGNQDPFKIMLMLALDPDYKDIGFYIWFSYKEESQETVLSIVNSFYPI